MSLFWQTCILLNNYTMSRDSSIFNEPESFIPERWLREESRHWHPFSAIPFGYGARACIGGYTLTWRASHAQFTCNCWAGFKLYHQIRCLGNRGNSLKKIKSPTLSDAEEIRHLPLCYYCIFFKLLFFFFNIYIFFFFFFWGVCCFGFFLIS